MMQGQRARDDLAPFELAVSINEFSPMQAKTAPIGNPHDQTQMFP
jgi:hypothetical protein